VPAAIMSIAAANTFSRNIYKEWLKPDATPKQEAKVSKLMSLLVKAFALVFVLTLDKQNAINFQLLGGIWILQTFPSWFAGVAFAAIAIGALVPAAIMSIAAANTFTRNVYKAWLRPDATVEQEAKVSKVTSLVVKAFALVFVLTLDKSNAINFQLLGGIWILQTFPSIVFYLYTRWFHRRALLIGWAVGMVYGTIAAYGVTNKATGAPFAGSVASIPVIGQLGYIALTAFAINVLVAAVLTLAFRAGKVDEGRDETIPADYFADAGDPRVE
jgi:SSS family solute:Na+ symporter